MATQFLGALNDNLFKIALSLALANSLLAAGSGMGQLVIINVIFVLPFLLLSQIAGTLSDRYSKTRIIRDTKMLEILVMLIGFCCFYYQQQNGLLLVLFLMGAQSTIFSPAKYGILPEILDSENLSKGNGYIELYTFLAIIIGTALSGILMTLADGNLLLPSAVTVGIALVGCLTSYFVVRVPPANEQTVLRYNPIAVYGTLKQMAASREIFLTILAIAFFWSLGALFQLNVIIYAKQIMALDDLWTAVLLAILSVGIGIGGMAAGRVSEGKVELGLVPLGAGGLALFCLLLSYSTESFNLTAGLLFCLGMSAGFYVVPLNSYLQKHSPKQELGAYLAASNFLSFGGMLIFSLALLLLVDTLKFGADQVFLVMGIGTVAAAIYIVTVLPEMLLRCLNWVMVHTVYRMTVIGRSNIPETGGALLVCNHVSFIDAPLILASIDRPVRFLIHKPIYDSALVNPVARAMKTIPILAGANREQVQHALSDATEAIKRGEIVCIFAEGGIARISLMLKFKRGLERIVEGTDAPIIPTHLDQMWGSIFSRQGGKFLWKIPKYLPYPVTVSFGEPLPTDAKSYQVRQKVQELAADAFPHRHRAYQVLHYGFIRTARRYLFRRCLSDSLGQKLSYHKVLTGSLAFADYFRQKLADDKMVAVYLPPSVPAALVNIGLMIAGKIPVNLNYTASRTALGSAITSCGIKHVITSAGFLEKVEFAPDFSLNSEAGNSETRAGSAVELLKLEELKSEITGGTKMFYATCALLLPAWAINRFLVSGDPQTTDLATVIFSSGSTGEPKGVMLSHGNISSNITSIYDIFDISESDCIMGVLPFFHSFGFTATLWLPLLSGARAVYHHNPMQAAAIGKLVSEHGATIMMGTPTFLQTYLKKVKPEQFATLRHVPVGAEKLKENLALAFEEKFGVLPREGYGCTELSPLAIANLDDFKQGRNVQTGSKLGAAGHPIPGVAVRIVDPETREILPPNQEGLLLVKGPNVMMGYLNNESKTAAVIKNGWYETGDIATLDDDGFIVITDRLSRFSKIAGEMVPHVRIEDEIHAILGRVDAVCAVSSVEDEQKGERLVVLCTENLDGAQLAKQLSEVGLPNLWIPKKENYFQVAELPVLGTGKLDLRGIKQLAKQVAA